MIRCFDSRTHPILPICRTPSSLYITEIFFFLKFGGCGSVLAIDADEPDPSPPLASTAGVREEEAIALLRLFYAQQNQLAPTPQKRTKKQLELAMAAEAVMLGGEVQGG